MRCDGVVKGEGLIDRSSPSITAERRAKLRPTPRETVERDEAESDGSDRNGMADKRSSHAAVSLDSRARGEHQCRDHRAEGDQCRRESCGADFVRHRAWGSGLRVCGHGHDQTVVVEPIPVPRIDARSCARTRAHPCRSDRSTPAFDAVVMSCEMDDHRLPVRRSSPVPSPGVGSVMRTAIPRGVGWNSLSAVRARDS